MRLVNVFYVRIRDINAQNPTLLMEQAPYICEGTRDGHFIRIKVKFVYYEIFYDTIQIPFHR